MPFSLAHWGSLLSSLLCFQLHFSSLFFKLQRLVLLTASDELTRHPQICSSMNFLGQWSCVAVPPSPLTGRLYQGPSSLACLSQPSKYIRAHYSDRSECKSCWMKAKDRNYLLLQDTYMKCIEIQIQRTPSIWRNSGTASLPGISGSRSCLQCSNSFSGSKLCTCHLFLFLSAQEATHPVREGCPSWSEQQGAGM